MRSSAGRFECLRGPPPVNIRPNAGRFECLREEYYTPYSNNAGRFECLADGYTSYDIPQQSPIVLSTPTTANRAEVPASPPHMALEHQHISNVALEPTYLPKPSSLMGALPHTLPGPAYVPPHKIAGAAPLQITPLETINPFPELPLRRPRLFSVDSMPEAAERTMIVAPVITPTDKRVLTSLSMKDGKVVRKEIYEDGTELPDGKPIVIVKRPTYMSWAGVIRQGENDVVYS
jgi:hypothetical protein